MTAAIRKFDLSINESAVRAFVGLPDAEERARAQGEHLFEVQNPARTNAIEKEAARVDVERAREKLEGVREKIDSTAPYGVAEEPDPAFKRNPIETFIGKVALGMMVLAALTIPGIAVMLIVEAQKIPLVADMPVFGMVFGVAALAGVLAAVELRSKLNSDKARLFFDRALLIATLVAFMIWSFVLSLSAYPIVFDEAAIAAVNDWGADPATEAQAAFVLEPPMVLLFWVTALLDLVAAPTLHQFALRRLTPRTVKRITPDAEYEHLSKQELHERQMLDGAAGFLGDIEAHNNRRASAKALMGETAVALVKRLTAEVAAAQKEAASQILFPPARAHTNGAKAPNGRHN